MRSDAWPSWAFVLLCVLAAALLAAPVPVLDEESYLAITAGLDPLKPYHWWRPWPPWYGGAEPDAFVYAHPPLFLQWVAIAQRLSDDWTAVRLLCGLPMAALLGFAAVRLAKTASARPNLVLAAWLSAPIVLLGLQRGLMPDLMVAALGSVAVLGWRTGTRRWLLLGGFALGLAASTKYAALALGPALVIHGWRTGRLAATIPFWVAAAVPWLAGELILFGVYGRIHLIEVLTRASEISRGTGEGRALGLLTRLPLGVLMLGLWVRGSRWMWAPALVLSGCITLWAWPAELALLERLGLGLFAVFGAVAIVLAVVYLVRGWRAPAQDSDALLFSLWALAVLGGVWGVHNFASPRYMLPAMLPLAILLVMEVGDRALARTLLWIGAGVSAIGALALTQAEHRFFEAGAALAEEVAQSLPKGRYTGEWSFRWRIDAQGWAFHAGEATPGTIVVAPVHGSPGELPAGWEVMERFVSSDTHPLRVVHDGAHIGMYAETLGALPVGWSTEPLEEVIAWRVR